ncbi:MAG: restriction endonuclease subunit S [Elusimicrobia bacterium]|nr:restriction endonuclease subunit S [Elusimicrobiota bacterium]
MLDETSNNIKEFIQEVKYIEEGKRTIFKEVKITDIFDITLGSAKYNHKYFSIHRGIYPVYSGQTKNNGEIAKINSFDHNIEGLTWTIDGYAGRVFYRNGKFSLTCHCGLLILKKELRDKFNYEFLKYLLDNELPNYAVGEGNKRLKKIHIEKISIKIPLDKGEYNLNRQKEIAKKYRVIEQIKNELKKELEKVAETSVDFS